MPGLTAHLDVNPYVSHGPPPPALSAGQMYAHFLDNKPAWVGSVLFFEGCGSFAEVSQVHSERLLQVAEGAGEQKDEEVAPSASLPLTVFFVAQRKNYEKDYSEFEDTYNAVIQTHLYKCQAIAVIPNSPLARFCDENTRGTVVAPFLRFALENDVRSKDLHALKESAQQALKSLCQGAEDEIEQKDEASSLLKADPPVSGMRIVGLCVMGLSALFCLGMGVSTYVPEMGVVHKFALDTLGLTDLTGGVAIGLGVLVGIVALYFALRTSPTEKSGEESDFDEESYMADPGELERELRNIMVTFATHALFPGSKLLQDRAWKKAREDFLAETWDALDEQGMVDFVFAGPGFPSDSDAEAISPPVSPRPSDEGATFAAMARWSERSEYDAYPQGTSSSQFER